MRSFVLGMALFLAAAPLGAQESGKCGSCKRETYGTAIHWSGSVGEAAREAKEKEKLVFILHVSGYFEDAAFT
jgi:hypothetical protein